MPVPQQNDPQLSSIAQEFLRAFTKNNANNGLLFPPADMRISDPALAMLTNTHVLMPLSRNELRETTSPGVKALFEEKDAQGNPLQVFLIPKMNALPFNEPLAQRMITKEGRAYILVDEGHHEWTVPYVRNMLMAPDSAFEALMKKETFLEPNVFISRHEKTINDPEKFNSIKKRYDTFIKYTADKLKEQKTNAHLLVNNGPNIFSGSNAALQISSNGNGYLILNQQSLINALYSDIGLKQWENLVSHEIAHAAFKDVSAEELIKSRSADIFRFREARADISGAGPLGGREPKIAEERTRGLLYSGLTAFRQETHSPKPPGAQLSLEETAQLSLWMAQGDALHPTYLDQINYYQYEAARMAEYEKAHPIQGRLTIQQLEGKDPVKAIEYKEKEQKWVFEQVLKDMGKTWQYPIKDPDAKPKAELKGGTTEEKLAGIKAAMAAALEQPHDLSAAPGTKPVSRTKTIY